ncbi:hypothetical protein E3P99_00891 [Wallemia hederae]|uniref:F-box domain-containing protein n=1 Tax=Wallemia hederae TaxID=1540922 RepID=A0A4T0FT79_9BASI|nr:hypothetical protein E3P99_00891 [Wallemia hederae]
MKFEFLPVDLQFADLRDLVSLLQVSRYFHDTFNFSSNNNLYSNLFANYFDITAPLRRFNLLSSNIALELRQRMVTLDRFHARLRNDILDDAHLLVDLLRLYLIAIESDYTNTRYSSLISLYSRRFIHSAAFPSPDDHLNSFILWLDYLYNDNPPEITPYKPFLFAAHHYDSFYAPWPYAKLPSAEFDAQFDDPFLTNLTLHDQSITITYFGTTMRFRPPLSSHAAFLTLHKYKNNLSKPRLTSKDFDAEFVRLTHCTDPSSSPGCSKTLFKNHFQGAWEGFFSYYEFDDYRDILAGSVDTLYNGVYAMQPQVWRLNEVMQEYKPSTSLSTLSDVCGNPQEQHLFLKQQDTTSVNDTPPINDILIQSDTMDEDKEIGLSGLGHSSWGRFTLRGKVRAWDGMFMLCKEYTPDRRGKWFYRGYSLPGGVLVGRWRDTYTRLLCVDEALKSKC